MISWPGARAAYQGIGPAMPAAAAEQGPAHLPTDSNA